MSQLEPVRRELYVPQFEPVRTAIEIISYSRYATLAQNMKLVIENQEVAKYYIMNTEVGNWTRTVLYYGVDGTQRWIEGPIQIIDEYNYNLLDGAIEGVLVLPPSGFVKPYLDKGIWKVWDVENGGFARHTVSGSYDNPRDVQERRREAEEWFREAEFDPRLLSFQARLENNYTGLVPVVRYSSKFGGPVDIYVNWSFKNFYKSYDDNFKTGYLICDGSDNKTMISRKIWLN